MKHFTFRAVGAYVCLGTLIFFVSGCTESVEMEFSGSTSVESGVSEQDASALEQEEAKTPAGGEAEAPDEEYDVKRAGVGATGKGQYGVTSEQPMSIITTPISTYFFAQEKTVFDMQIPQAMNLFQASEGRYPNSEEEFMERIIKANMINLPKLKDGDSYFYDVPSHTLMIRTVKQN